MNSLNNNRELILKIIDQVERQDETIFSHSVIENISIDNSMISIVMTSHNRSRQVYFTLQTISNSKIKNVHIILVDDSTNDLVELERLQLFPFYIDFIQIHRHNKKWHNPCVNYNIGFQFVKGSKVIIQNSEVCHIGDLLQDIYDQEMGNNYYVFDVKASLDHETNEVIYNSNVSDIKIYNEEHLFLRWYQSSSNNRKLHFLTACTRETFNNIGGFSYDYTMGGWYDDDDFVLKIISKGIPIVNKFHTECRVGGIHQFHGMSSDGDGWDNAERNDTIWNHKKNHYLNTGQYIDLVSK